MENEVRVRCEGGGKEPEEKLVARSHLQFRG